MKPWGLMALLVAAVPAAALLVSTKTRSNGVCRLVDKLFIYLLAMGAWPALYCYVTGDAAYDPLSLAAFLVVQVYLVAEIRALTPFEGPLEEYEHHDSLVDRTRQITAATFAVGTLLMTQKRDMVVKRASPILFTALLLVAVCTLPSPSVRRDMERRGIFDGVTKISITFAGGLLCVAIAACHSANAQAEVM